jgi:hypothetical protein
MKRNESLKALIEKGLLSERLKALLDSCFTYEWGWQDGYPDEEKVKHLFSGHLVMASKFMRGGGIERVKSITIPTRKGRYFLVDALQQAYMQPYLVVALYSMTNMLKHGEASINGLRWKNSYPSEVFVFHLDENKNVEGEQIL